MKKLLIALSAVFASPAVFAQASNFAGFFGQVGVGYEYNTVGSTGPNNWRSSDGVGPSFSQTGGAAGKSFGNAIAIGYGLALTDRILLQIGAEYQPLGGDTRPFDIQFTNVNRQGQATTGGPNRGNYYRVLNRYGIFLSPGYAIDDNKMAYLKVGYTAQTVNARTVPINGVTLLSDSKDVGGFMVGLGYRQLLSSNVYIFAEANYSDYAKAGLTFRSNRSPAFTNTSSPKSNNFNALVGIGARF
jgi:hypothetical protein